MMLTRKTMTGSRTMATTFTLKVAYQFYYFLQQRGQHSKEEKKYWMGLKIKVFGRHFNIHQYGIRCQTFVREIAHLLTRPLSGKLSVISYPWNCLESKLKAVSNTCLVNKRDQFVVEGNQQVREAIIASSRQLLLAQDKYFCFFRLT